MDNAENNWSLAQFKWSLQALALPGHLQRSVFPSFVWVGDELVLDYDLWREMALKEHTFTEEQFAALAAVDAVLFKMSEENNMEFWDEAAVDHPRWEQVREAARKALTEFEWSPGMPPKNRSIYVGPPDE